MGRTWWGDTAAEASDGRAHVRKSGSACHTEPRFRYASMASLNVRECGSSTCCQPIAPKLRMTLLPILALLTFAAILSGPPFHLIKRLPPGSAWPLGPVQNRKIVTITPKHLLRRIVAAFRAVLRIFIVFPNP